MKRIKKVCFLVNDSSDIYIILTFFLIISIGCSPVREDMGEGQLYTLDVSSVDKTVCEIHLSDFFRIVWCKKWIRSVHLFVKYLEI